MTLEEAKDIILKDMMCEDRVGLCSFACEKCAFNRCVDDSTYDTAYSIVVKHYIELKEVKNNGT